MEENKIKEIKNYKEDRKDKEESNNKNYNLELAIDEVTFGNPTF
ncbi:hypothetical protein [Clostridium niameyense]|nr:hypothetical protein [Clostridium niameyense]